jgi:hypothetical protein
MEESTPIPLPLHVGHLTPKSLTASPQMLHTIIR